MHPLVLSPISSDLNKLIKNITSDHNIVQKSYRRSLRSLIYLNVLGFRSQQHITLHIRVLFDSFL